MSNQWWSLWSRRQLTEVLLFGILGNEVAALRHLLDQEGDGPDVRLDCLQRLGVMDEPEDVTYRAC